MMQGMTWASLKKNPALIPLYVCIAGGCAWAAYYTLRLATRSPEVTWRHKSNPGMIYKRYECYARDPVDEMQMPVEVSKHPAEPWEDYRAKQYKFYSPIRDYSKEESPAPKYWE